MNIDVPSDFSFASTVISHGWYLLAPFHWSRTGQTLHRPEVLGRSVVDLEIGSGPAGQLSVSGSIPRGAEAQLREKLARMFQLDIDMSGFLAAAVSSPAHAWVVDARFGRLLCGSTLFEDIVKIIATTNTTWRQTMRMVELLVEKCGRRSKLGNAAFPEPRDIVRFSADELKNDCRLGYRADYVHQLASGILDGSIDLGAIASSSQTTAELFKSYRTLPGIGPYGAAHLLAMDGRHDFIAVDSEFRRFVRETYHGGRAIGDRTMLRRYAKWGRWKYLAYWSELWSSVAGHLQPLEREDK